LGSTPQYECRLSKKYTPQPAVFTKFEIEKEAAISMTFA
jgi:hypothetical protein